MSSNFVMLVLKTNIYFSKLIVIQHCTSLVSEHSIPDSDLMEGHEIVFVHNVRFLRYALV